MPKEGRQSVLKEQTPKENALQRSLGKLLPVSLTIRLYSTSKVNDHFFPLPDAMVIGPCVGAGHAGESESRGFRRLTVNGCSNRREQGVRVLFVIGVLLWAQGGYAADPFPAQGQI